MDLCQNSGALLTFNGYTRRSLNYIATSAAENNRCHVGPRCPGQISLRPAAAQSAALGLALVTAPLVAVSGTPPSYPAPLLLEH